MGAEDRLAIDGGEPVAEGPFPPGWLGPAEIGVEEIATVSEVLREQRLFRFHHAEKSKVSEFENRFRRMTGCAHALAVGGGTASLICGLTGIGVGDGDEVIVPAYTYIASAAAVLICGGVPVIAEIDETLTMDAADAERKITKRTRAIMPVHMRGFPCDMDAIMEVARRHNLLVIEDVAQACGGSYKGRRLGSIGNAGCFSFQQSKVITAGEGGMVVTNDQTVFERAALRHDSAMCFWKPDGTHIEPFPGENFRMDEMRGALGCVQFDRMEGILRAVRAAKKQIVGALGGLPSIPMHVPPCIEGECGITVAFLLDTAERAKWIAGALRAEGLPAGSMYDKGIPDRHIYRFWEYVMEKKSADRHGWPWTSTRHDQSRSYSPDMCPRSLDILGRTVTIGLTQRFEQKHIDWIIRGVLKVARHMAA